MKFDVKGRVASVNDLLGAALRCPLCGEPLAVVGNSLVCAGARRHTYDMARAGYVNLNTHLPQSGDTAEMAAARQAFLRRGYYAPLADALVRTAQAHTPGTSLLCDAGCGEGYYTEAVGAGFAAVLGADLSKYALALAGKSAKRAGLAEKLLYTAASVYDLPLMDSTCDCVMSVFAPIAAKEVFRVLKPGGVLLTAAAGRDHLTELKAVLYDTVIPNDTRRDYPENLTLLHTENLRFTADIAKGDIYPLFTMTPYFYRTKKERAARLSALDALTVTLDFELRVYKKESY